MSAVTATHRDLTGLLRRHGAILATDTGTEFDEDDVSRRVEQYHRTGGYREVRVVTGSRDFLVALWASVGPILHSDLRNVRVTPEIVPMHAGHGGWTLDVSIRKSDAPEVATLSVRERDRPSTDGAGHPQGRPAAQRDDAGPLIWWLTEADARRLDLMVKAGLDVRWTDRMTKAYGALDWKAGLGRALDSTEAGCPAHLDIRTWPADARTLAEGSTGMALDRAALPHVANLGGIVTEWDGGMLALAAA